MNMLKTDYSCDLKLKLMYLFLFMQKQLLKKFECHLKYMVHMFFAPL